MNRARRILTLAAILGGWVIMGTNLGWAGPPQFGCGDFGMATPVPGVQGPWGAPVPMMAPYSAVPPGEQAAYAMMSQSVPLSLVQPRLSQGGVMQAGMQMPAGGMPGMMGAGIAPPGVPYSPGMPAMAPPQGAVAAVGPTSALGAPPAASQRTQVLFTQPMDMKVSWFGPGANGVVGGLSVRGRYNFLQGAIYRLKLSNIPNYPSLDLYPTLEVVPGNIRTAAFLAHSAVPLAFTEEDFAQVVAGNYIVKVIYLPDPQNQELAATAPGEIVSTSLQPGVDPIAEAALRGSILLVVRLSNIDLEAKNTPAMTAPNPYCATPTAQQPGPMPPAGARSGIMVPYGMQNSGQPLIMGRGLQPLQMTPQGPVPMGGGAGPMMGAPSGMFLPPSMPTPPANAGPPGTTGKLSDNSTVGSSAVQQASATDSNQRPASKPSLWKRLFGSKSTKTDASQTAQAPVPPMPSQPTP